MDSTSELRLSYQEKKFAKVFAKNILYHIGQKNATTSKNIMESYNASQGLKLTRRRVRDIVSYCRAKGMIKNLVAGSSGYWIENDTKELKYYLRVLDSRIREIKKIKTSIVFVPTNSNQINLF